MSPNPRLEGWNLDLASAARARHFPCLVLLARSLGRTDGRTECMRVNEGEKLICPETPSLSLAPRLPAPAPPPFAHSRDGENLSDSALLEVSLQMMRRPGRLPLSGSLRVSHVRIPVAVREQYLSDMII